MAKTAKQLDAEIADFLALRDRYKKEPPSDHNAELLRTVNNNLVHLEEERTILKAPRLTKKQIQKLRGALRKAIKYEKGSAVYLRRGYLEHDDYERAAADATRAAGLNGRTAAQPADNGVEIWEVVPGVGAVGDQIAEYHDDDYDQP